MKTIENPVLPGFNPDPSICRVGDNFYIAVSTFEWYPGVQIWHSTDLVEWALLHRPLDSSRLLDLRGVQSSGGVWAPCLSHDNGLFYLVFTVVRRWRGDGPSDHGFFKDTLNYVTTAPAVEGPWSDPVFLNASGFDPSIFHENGRHWLLNMEWDYRGEPTHFSGILLQELDGKTLKPRGKIRKIFKATELDYVEGPHLYVRNGWYYLLCAEGGTEYEHAVTVARSRNIDGPYEVHPDNPMLSSLKDRIEDREKIKKIMRGREGLAPEGFYNSPQKAGHASICPLTEDEWILVHLSGRPLHGTAVCPLGRETSFQSLRWFDDWPHVVDSEGKIVKLAQQSVSIPALGNKQEHDKSHNRYLNTDWKVEDLFDGTDIHPAFRFLRCDPGEDVVIDTGKKRLVLTGRESIRSEFYQSLAAVSVTSHHYSVETCVYFEPLSFQQMAGLIVRYDERNQYYLRIAGDASGKRSLGIIRYIQEGFDMPLEQEIQLKKGAVYLRLVVRGANGRFFWKQDKEESWIDMETDLDMRKLSDEGVDPQGFTGTFAGMAAHDMTGSGCKAKFSFFRYVSE